MRVLCFLWLLGVLSSAACGGDGGHDAAGIAAGNAAAADEAPPSPALRRLQVPHYALADPDLILAERPIAFAGLPADTFAYNPSLVDDRGRLITVVRLEKTRGRHGTRLANRLAATVLDERGQALQPLTLLETPHVPGELWTAEDARLLSHRGRLWVVYNMATDARADGPHRMRLARLEVEDRGAHRPLGFRLTCDRPMHYQHPDTPTPPHLEKNWSPFSDGERLCFLYRSNPIVAICLKDAQLDGDAPVLRPTLAGEGSRVAPWAHGLVRGGTPATFVPELDRFVAFFHSHGVSQIGDTPSRRHYFTGFYSFFAAAPFEIEHIARAPLYSPYWLADLLPAIWHIAFVSGAVWRDGYVLIAYGRNDLESAMMVLDRRELVRRLSAGGTGPS